MKIIDLLNKIANVEEDLPKRIKYKNRVYYLQHYCNGEIDYTNEDNLDEIYHLFNGAKVNDEVEIIEEKKIPEKLPYYSLEKIQKAKNKDEWREERISLLEKRIDDYHNKINEIIDYLKSKGE